MKQEKLEEKVRELFERQGFELEKEENSFEARKDGEELVLEAFSSEEFGKKDVVDSVEEGDKVFVDKELSNVKDNLDSDVSVLEEEGEEQDYETPSYEVIGDIAVINKLDEIDREETVEGILANQNVKTILLKKGGLKGEFRVGDYERLYGEETKTVHTEFGCRYRVDPTKVFFSEREATERKRVLDQVEDREKILVMFCGIGPYPILLASKKDVEVVGVEKNPEAAEYARENVKLNNLEEQIEIIEGDVREEVPKLRDFDRVIMPSPTNAHEFLDLALKASKSGTQITLYGISDKETPFKDFTEEIQEKTNLENFKVDFRNKRIVSDYSPSQQKIAIDFTVKDLAE